MLSVDRSKYLNFVLTDLRYCGGNSFYTATDALLTLEAEVFQAEEPSAEREKRTQKQIERLPVLEMLRKYGLGEQREHLLLTGKPGSGKSTTLRRLCVELAKIALADEYQPIPVFVQLKGDKTILTLIQAEFRRAKLKVTAEQIDDLLLADKLVLLLDGVNEIPSEQLRRELQDFRENNLTTPTIFTTRDLTVGGSLGIDKRLEMRPLTDEQMREFVRKYLPEHGDKLLGQLRDRLREIAETPLLLKMLCEVFEPATGRIPQNKAELFELFDRKYQCHKEGVAISADFRRFQSEILQYLAFTMLQGDAQKPTEAWLTLPRDRAEGMLEAWLKQRGETDPASKAKEWLEDLVEHHLLQVAADPQQIEFHHQLFQEYYAARHLRSMLQNRHPDLVDDDRLKHFYLNYLKWTEPLGLLLGLLDDEAQALRLVGLGLEVDWFLGARLAGKVKQGFQKQTVELVDRLIEENALHKGVHVRLWQEIRLSTVLPKILRLLRDPDSDVRLRVVDAILNLGGKSILTDLLPLLQDPDSYVQERVINAIFQLADKSILTDLLPLLQDLDSYTRSRVINAIFQLADKSTLPNLLPLLQDPDSYVQERVIDAIAQLADKSFLPYLLDLLSLPEDPDFDRQSRVIDAIVKLADKSFLPYLVDLLPLVQNSYDRVRPRVIHAIVEFGNKDNTLLHSLEYSYSQMLWSVIDAIVELGDNNTMPDLLSSIQYPDFVWRLNVASEIAQLGDGSNLSNLLACLKISDSHLRLRVVNAISRFGDRSNIPNLLPLLQDPNYLMQRSVINTIVQLADKNSISELLPLLQDSDCHVRGNALCTITRLGDKSNVPDLLPLLQDPEDWVQLDAVRTIAKLGGEKAVVTLTHVAEIRGVSMRKSAIEGLGGITEWEKISPLNKSLAINTILDSLEMKNKSVRFAAANSLAKIGNYKILPRLWLKLAASLDDNITEIILAIQARCQFYNYEIFCSPPPSIESLATESSIHNTEYHFPNATEVKIFERVDRYYETPPSPKD